jgi:hypothetical protein
MSCSYAENFSVTSGGDSKYDKSSWCDKSYKLQLACGIRRRIRTYVIDPDGVKLITAE